MSVRRAFDYNASRPSRLGSSLVAFRKRLLSLRAAAWLRMTDGGCNAVSLSALLQRLLSIGGRELDFKLMDLIPLGVSPPALRYGQKLLQATVGGTRLWCIHGDIIPSFARGSPARHKPPAGPTSQGNLGRTTPQMSQKLFLQLLLF